LLPIVLHHADYNEYEQCRHDEEQISLKFVDHRNLSSALDCNPAPHLAPLARRTFSIKITAITQTLDKKALTAAGRR
jgi:hypothetical protein